MACPEVSLKDKLAGPYLEGFAVEGGLESNSYSSVLCCCVVVPSGPYVHEFKGSVLRNPLVSQSSVHCHR